MMAIHKVFIIVQKSLFITQAPMPKNQILTVEGHEIVIFSHQGEDFICLTDIMKSVDANQKIEKRMSNRGTIDFLGTWEAMHNPDFDYPAFGDIRTESGTTSFTISVTKRKETTKAIGIFARTGKFGGTYAHKDIAFEFASWLSPQFKLYILKEFQRLKEEEQKNMDLGWNIKRLISKANYRIHTDAIKENLSHTVLHQKYLYTNEAEILNIALFGMTSSERTSKNPKKAQKWNIRDDASVEELTVLSNLEVLNAEMIKNQISQESRQELLTQRASEQLRTLSKLGSIKEIKEKEETEKIKRLWTNKKLK